MERQSKQAITAIALVSLCLFTSQAWASMTITATSTTLTVTMHPDLPGGFGGYSWTALVGPVRLRDKQTMNAGREWSGMNCQGTIFPCPASNWTRMEQAWVTFFHGNTITVPRTDADWQPGDQVCEGTAFAPSRIIPWNPDPGSISIPGSCVALPNPHPVSCELTTSGVDHGEVTVPNVNGNAASASASLRCTGNATVKVRAILSAANPISTVPVRADGSITSRLTVNGVDGATGLNIPVIADQAVAVTVGSTLASGTPSLGALQGSAVVVADHAAQVQKPISIAGNVVPPSAPKAVLNMALITGTVSNLGVSWGWSTMTADYGSDSVPANYAVGLFIRNASQNKWSAFRIDTASSPAASWSDRIQRFHDAWPNGGINEQASRMFESGVWCVRLAAASTAETGGIFLPAPGSAESCATIPARHALPQAPSH